MRSREGTASAGKGEGTARGPGGVGWAEPPGKEPRRRPRPGPSSLTWSRPIPPLLPAPLSLPQEVPVLLRPFRSHVPLSPLPTPGPITSDPGPAPGGTSGRVSPLPAPRLPLPELFLHVRVPARPRGAAFLCRRLRGRHTVRAVRQRRPESENGAAGALDGAGGAGILGSDDKRCQESSTEIANGLEHHTRFLQPERGR